MYGSVGSDENTKAEGNRRQTPPQDGGSLSLQDDRQGAKLGFAMAMVVAIFVGIVSVTRPSSSSISGSAVVHSSEMLPAESQTSVPMLGNAQQQQKPSAISKRGQSIKNVRDDLLMFQTGASDPFHPTDNPQGYLVLLMSENKLMWQEMARKMEAVESTRSLPQSIFTYGDFGGEAMFKKSMARMMQRWIRNAPVDTQYLRFQSGAGSILDQLSTIITDPGDGVLHMGPGYSAFASDFGVYGRTRIHVVETHASNNYAPTRDQLGDAFRRSLKAGNNPRILVICQPNNPTGSVYSKAAMKEMIQWALDSGLHVVSDEIYALSTFPGVNTTSAADIMMELNQPDADTNNRYLGDYVHIVAGLSKDWGMSGFRVGSLLSHNEKFLAALDIISYYQGVSSYTQLTLTSVFEDEDFVAWYIDENRRRLYETYQALEEAFALVQVPVFPAQGAIFAWVDMSSYLKPGQTEKELWTELFHDAKVCLTSGESFYGEKPGMFRVVYSWPEGGPEAMKELGQRLVRWAAER